MSEAACRSNERPKPPANRAASDIIDETEFLALEKLLLLFGQRARKERRESDAKQLNDCFDGDARYKNPNVVNGVGHIYLYNICCNSRFDLKTLKICYAILFLVFYLILRVCREMSKPLLNITSIIK